MNEDSFFTMKYDYILDYNRKQVFKNGQHKKAIIKLKVLQFKKQPFTFGQITREQEPKCLTV
jgi:hypothetical protein